MRKSLTSTASSECVMVTKRMHSKLMKRTLHKIVRKLKWKLMDMHTSSENSTKNNKKRSLASTAVNSQRQKNRLKRKKPKQGMKVLT